MPIWSNTTFVRCALVPAEGRPPYMVLVAELDCGEIGGREGVELGDQLVVPANGVRNLVPYPYSEALLR